MKTQRSVDVSENIDVVADVVNTESETDMNTSKVEYNGAVGFVRKKYLG